MSCWFGQDLDTVLADQGQSCSYVQPRNAVATEASAVTPRPQASAWFSFSERAGYSQ